MNQYLTKDKVGGLTLTRVRNIFSYNFNQFMGLFKENIALRSKRSEVILNDTNTDSTTGELRSIAFDDWYEDDHLIAGYSTPKKVLFTGTANNELALINHQSDLMRQALIFASNQSSDFDTVVSRPEETIAQLSLISVQQD